MLRKAGKFAVSELPIGGEIAPLYEGGMKFHFVDYGKLRLYNLLPNGRCITISILGPGDVFLQWRAESGSLSCLCAEAMQPSRVISASEADMTEIVGAQPAAAIDVIASFARRLTESQVLIEDLLNNSVNLRLYRTLLELSKQFGKPDGDLMVIDFPLTHQRLADMIGSNRVTVTRKLHDLQERNIIETRKNATIALRDSNALAKLAESGSFNPFSLIAGENRFHSLFLAPFSPALSQSIARFLADGTGPLEDVVRIFQGKGAAPADALQQARRCGGAGSDAASRVPPFGSALLVTRSSSARLPNRPRSSPPALTCPAACAAIRPIASRTRRRRRS